MIKQAGVPAAKQKLSVTSGTRAGKLKAKPIMIYPNSPEERQLITDAAARVGGRRISVSSFVMDSALKIANVILREEASSYMELDPTITTKPRSATERQPEATANRISDETPEAKAYRLTEKLRGLLKQELAEYGGAEGFMRWVRSEDGDIA